MIISPVKENRLAPFSSLWSMLFAPFLTLVYLFGCKSQVNEPTSAGFAAKAFQESTSGGSLAVWIRDTHSDDGAKSGGAADGGCNGREDCVYQDQKTGSFWTRIQASLPREAALKFCPELIYGGYRQWRLPTSKDFLMAQQSGIAQVAASLHLDKQSHIWVLLQPNSGSVGVFTLADGQVQEVSESYGDQYGVLCIR